MNCIRFKVILITLLGITSVSDAQIIINDSLKTEKEKLNEVKINLFYAIFRVPELSYERIFKNKLGIGTSFQIIVNGGISGADNILVQPYIRRYLSKTYGDGFFAEVHTSIFQISEEELIGLSVGPTIGFKQKVNNWSWELALGIGPVVVNQEEYGAILLPRYGISVGRRF